MLIFSHLEVFYDSKFDIIGYTLSVESKHFILIFKINGKKYKDK